MMTRSIAHAELLEGRREQVVGQRPLRGQALELHRDRARLPRPDPDRQVAVAVGLLEDDHVAAGEHVDPDALDDHLDQPVVHRPDYPTVGRGRRPARAGRGRTTSTRATSAPTTNPPMWAKNATPPPVSTMPERRQPVDELEHEPEPEHDDRRHVDQLVEEAEEDERGDPRPREEHEVGARASPRSRPTRRSSGSSRSGRWRPGRGRPATPPAR